MSQYLNTKEVAADLTEKSLEDLMVTIKSEQQWALAGQRVGKTDQVRDEAQQRGFTGDACGDCGNFTMVRNGVCLVCQTCGRTTGCS